MARIQSKRFIVYGPFFSRRLGRSLGINLFQEKLKVCSFDCVYCEVGKTQTQTLDPSLHQCNTVDDILWSVEEALKKPRTIEHLTLSGNGEPTLHLNFPEIIQGIKQIIARFRPDVKLALLTNGSKASTAEFQAVYPLIDKVMIKLDAGDNETFKAINQPIDEFTFPDLMKGLRQTPGLILQSCLIEGEFTNIHGPSFKAWVDTLRALNPVEVQIYSIERPISNKLVRKVVPNQLFEVENELQALGIHAQAYWRR